MKKRLLHRFYPCATAPSLFQQLIQFVINGLDLRADNDLTGVFPRTEDACCACRFYGLLIDLIVVLDHKAQAGSAVADRYYVVFAADAFQITLSEFFAKAEGSESAPVALTSQQMQVIEKWSILRPDQQEAFLNLLNTIP